MQYEQSMKMRENEVSHHLTHKQQLFIFFHLIVIVSIGLDLRVYIGLREN
jgi:hypothetical protein